VKKLFVCFVMLSLGILGPIGAYGINLQGIEISTSSKAQDHAPPFLPDISTNFATSIEENAFTLDRVRHFLEEHPSTMWSIVILICFVLYILIRPKKIRNPSVEYSTEELSDRLNLARGLLEMHEFERAKEILLLVEKCGDDSLKKEAKRLLNSVPNSL
jgi:FimV-like protein